MVVLPAGVGTGYRPAGWTVPLPPLRSPGNPDTAMIRNPLTHIRSRAAEGMPELAERLKSEFS